MNRYKNNIDLLKNNNVYSKEMEHDACGVGLVACLLYTSDAADE